LGVREKKKKENEVVVVDEERGTECAFVFLRRTTG